ncbi:MAG: prephenate dehydrogenase/arogenate dehydrogenase family protein, partial [Hydrogenophilales bacterium]
MKKIDCLIVGLGLIGGSFALSFRKSFPNSKIYGYDLKKKSIEIALKKKIIDRRFNFDSKIFEIKLVIIAVPSLKAVEIFKDLKKINVPKDTTIFDLS